MKFFTKVSTFANKHKVVLVLQLLLSVMFFTQLEVVDCKNVTFVVTFFGVILLWKEVASIFVVFLAAILIVDYIDSDSAMRIIKIVEDMLLNIFHNL